MVRLLIGGRMEPADIKRRRYEHYNDFSIEQRNAVSGGGGIERFNGFAYPLGKETRKTRRIVVF